ncbi:MAG: phosphomannomutase/phosphoglucomutase [Parcubacteria group bacterium CG07_land_8_20_14_0_80_35_11]|nr:MAG: phosphomannomutase/phosphoglucomutase [Parcubacteria group bacterium CG07_land_8_20_14_0_80_35_11]
MKIDPEIFKAYDIRGTYPDKINKEIALQIGRAFYEFLRKDNKKPLTIVVSRDNRLSSNILAKALKTGIKIQGGRVIDIGLSTTPMLYFGVIFLGADGGINVTASHNPPEYNGFKPVREKAVPLSGDTGIYKIREMVQKDKIVARKTRGEEVKKNILNEYINFNLKFLDRSKILPFKIVVDTANAVCGVLIKELAKKLKRIYPERGRRIKIYHLFAELDGRFPNHNPDPLEKENLKFLQKEVLKRKADFGIGLDGDGDRIIFVDEKARTISGDLITALIAKRILQERPGEKILYDIRSSRVVKEIIKENRGLPILSRVGHSFIAQKLIEKDAFFGGEFSGHYYLKIKEDAFSEVPLFALFKIMEELSRQRKPLSKLVVPYQKYVSSGEINFKIQDKKGAMKKVENYFLSKAKKTSVLRAKRAGSYFKRKKGFKLSHLDGVKIEAKEFWILVRPSNTEPLLRLSIEANNKKILNQKIKEVKRVLGV